MAKIDMNAPDPSLTAGVDLWEVKEADDKRSRNGDEMFAVKFRRVSGKAGSVLDFVMLEGPGWGMGKAKLSALGIPKDFTGELRAATLIGRRVWLATKVETYEGQDNLKVDGKQLSHRGYQAEATPPEGVKRPAVPATPTGFTSDEVDDTPF